MVLPRATFTMALCVFACQNESATPDAQAIVPQSSAQRTTLARFAGQWVHPSDSNEQRVAHQAVRRVTESMNPLIRAMAESRLIDAVQIDPTLRIDPSPDAVTVVRGTRAISLGLSAEKTPNLVQTKTGDSAQGWSSIEGNTLRTRVETSQGGAERIYSIDVHGRLRVVTRMFSPRLPSDVEYTAHYRRP